MDKLKQFKKTLRLTQTDAENLLWYHLRNRNFFNFKFRRQHVLEGYIVDFICLEKKLIIELDGGQHVEQEEYDLIRSNQLIKRGYSVIRFWNNEVLMNIEEILAVIQNTLMRK